MAEFRDFLVQIDCLKNLKVRKLQRKFGAEGVLGLLRLWAYTAGNAPDGLLVGLTLEDVGMAADLPDEIDPMEFAEGLMRLRLIDQTPSGIELHEWLDHQPTIRKSLELSAKGRAGAEARWQRNAQTDRASSGHDGTGNAQPDLAESGHDGTSPPSLPPSFQPASPPSLPPAPPPPKPADAPSHPGLAGDLEAQASRVISTWNEIAERWPDAVRPVKPNLSTQQSVARALLRPEVRSDWPEVLESIRASPPRYRKAGPLALTAVLSERDWPRWASGELLGDGKPKGLIEETEDDLRILREIRAEEEAQRGKR